MVTGFWDMLPVSLRLVKNRNELSGAPNRLEKYVKPGANLMDTKTLIDLYKHMEWADAAVWTAVLESEPASADPKLKEYFTHLHIVQRAFLLMWRKEDLPSSFPEFSELKQVLTWARKTYGEGISQLEAMRDPGLSEPLPLPWAKMVEQTIGKPPQENSIGETALQVIMHSMYHRGQINARLKALEGKPPLVDYICWVWLGRPHPAWPPSIST
jgi:uncharacterized damage-inducible protein DinB